MWLALPGADVTQVELLLDLIAEEVNVKAIERIDDESALVDRRVKPLLPKIGKRLGPAIPAVMAAARDGAFELHGDGSVTLGGVTLAPDEVEILATPRPGRPWRMTRAWSWSSTWSLPELCAGDARAPAGDPGPPQDAGLDLDARIELWVTACRPGRRISPPWPVDARRHGHARAGSVGDDILAGSVELTDGTVSIAVPPPWAPSPGCRRVSGSAASRWSIAAHGGA
jgi:hypothetical protein